MQKVRSLLNEDGVFLNHAISRLQDVLDDVRVSRVRETVPIDVQGPQALFLAGKYSSCHSLTACESAAP